LKDESTGQYLWQPSLTQGSANTIFGMEVVESADMPILSDGAFAVAFGDFESGYQIVDRQGIRILRDPFTEKPFIKFYATKRVGGGLINGNAIKLLQLSA
jgi:HK97 family phage major capsid protein